MPFLYDENSLPAYCPWGKPDYITEYGEGIVSVSTPSHGGFLLSAEKNEQIPSEFRRDDRAYEEDCNWCIPYLTFQSEIRSAAPKEFDENREIALMVAKHWHPRFYELHANPSSVTA